MSIEIYSTDTDSGQVTVVRKVNTSEYERVTEIPVGNAPRGAVKFTKGGRGFVSNTSANTVSEIDALTHREVARITVGQGPRGLGIVPGERFMLASNSGSNTVSIVDLESRTELRQVAVGRDPRHMAITKDGKTAYVCVWGSGYIAKLDISSLAEGTAAGVREIARIDVGPEAHPYSANIDPKGRYLFVANTTADYVTVIDLETDTVAREVKVRETGARAVAFSPDNRYAFVTIERISSVAVIRMSDFEVTRYISVGPAPRGLAIDSADFTIYVSLFSRSVAEPRPDRPFETFMSNSLTVLCLKGVDLDSPDDAVTYYEIPVGDGPCSVSVFEPQRVVHETPTATTQEAAVREPALAG